MSHIAEPNQDLGRLRNQFISELNRLYEGEIEHLNVLPEMARLAPTPPIQSALQYHFEKTPEHVERLRRIFAGLGRRPADLISQVTCPASANAQPWPAAAKNLADCETVLITAARNLEHHAIAHYLLALNYAQILRDQPAAELLEQTLGEEYEADHILAALTASGADDPLDKAAPRNPRVGSAART